MSKTNQSTQTETESLFYIAPEGLTNARKVAGFLNRPLLLAGEPGTGKTTFADHIKSTEDRDKFVFNTKSVSLSNDLFYTYDPVAHFASSGKSALEFIKLEALGKAIINAYGADNVRRELLSDPNPNKQIEALRNSPDAGRIVDDFLDGCNGKPSVVLIDEIDKAPRDFPNDILNEIEKLQFYIRELGINVDIIKGETDPVEIKAKKDKVFVLLTSNFEKNLPDAFLRRCLFYNIEFPTEKELVRIVNKHVSGGEIEKLGGIKVIEDRLREITGIRNNKDISKRPATSEIIDCIKWMVEDKTLANKIIGDRAALATLIKKKEDLDQLLKS